MNESIVSTLEFEVRGYDCGYGGELRPFALVNFLQEVAGVNATRLGFGMDELHAESRTWMLSRLDLRVDALPKDGERILVRSWPAGAKKLFAMRAIEVLRPDGSSLVRAVYAYLVVDLAARRPLRPASVFGTDFPGSGEPFPVTDYGFEIPEAASKEISFAQRVSGRHIDYNGHANNAHILNWLVDAAAKGEPGRLSALRVEFASEALEGDELVATKGKVAASPFGIEAATSSTLAELTRGDAKIARALVGRK
jgi:medium-chain acyl-[acyl-carrier-protein] hydrolase